MSTTPPKKRPDAPTTVPPPNDFDEDAPTSVVPGRPPRPHSHEFDEGGELDDVDTNDPRDEGEDDDEPKTPIRGR
jgi:hypothetical protein